MWLQRLESHGHSLNEMCPRLRASTTGEGERPLVQLKTKTSPMVDALKVEEMQERYILHQDCVCTWVYIHMENDNRVCKTEFVKQTSYYINVLSFSPSPLHFNCIKCWWQPLVWLYHPDQGDSHQPGIYHCVGKEARYAAFTSSWSPQLYFPESSLHQLEKNFLHFPQRCGD